MYFDLKLTLTLNLADHIQVSVFSLEKKSQDVEGGFPSTVGALKNWERLAYPEDLLRKAIRTKNPH